MCLLTWISPVKFSNLMHFECYTFFKIQRKLQNNAILVVCPNDPDNNPEWRVITPPYKKLASMLKRVLLQMTKNK